MSLNLSSIDKLSNKDSLIFFNTQNSDLRRITMATFVDYLRAQLKFGDLDLITIQINALESELYNFLDNPALVFDASNFDIGNPPIKFSYPDMSDGDSSKGGIIEWGGIMNGGTSYPYGIATQAYKDNPAATFTAPGVGDIYRKWAWLLAHYDSPVSTGEDVHQHLNLETVKADWLTAVTRFQISFGEDIALVSFPNSNVKFYPDSYVLIGSNANGLYIKHDTAANRIDMTSTTNMSFNQDLVIGANDNSGARLDVKESADRNMLRLSSSLGSANGSAQLLINGTTAGGTAIQMGLSGEGTNRWSTNTSGRMEWGSGSASRDTNLYRNAANELKTDDTFNIGGGQINASVVKTADYTLTSTDYVVYADTGLNSITLTLPTAVGRNGQAYIIKKRALANTMNINTTSSQTIDGAASLAITAQYTVIKVISDGANWNIL